MIDSKKCYICKFDPLTGQALGSQKNRTLHWHADTEKGDIWVWCNGLCQRGYSIYEYSRLSGLNIADIFNSHIEFFESAPNEVNAFDWPKSFISLFKKEAEEGVEYLNSRDILPQGDMFYDVATNGIVFPYYYHTTLCGAQIRFIQPKDEHKITTLPGTRLSLLFYSYNQLPIAPHVRMVIVTEGAFDALSIQQSLDTLYDTGRSPFLVCATSGSNISKHHIEVLTSLKDAGLKIVAAPDSDEAGMGMFQKMVECSTHYAMTDDPLMDWNKLLCNIGRNEMASLFPSMVKKL
jgi:DNA primase